MEDLKIETESRPSGVSVVRLSGPLTLGSLFEFQDRLRKEAGPAIILDLTSVPYMDSAGLGAVLGVLASCQRHNRGFGVTGVTDRIKTLFTVGRVDGLIPTFDSVEAAESKISKSATA